jgi:hypothetical protein
MAIANLTKASRAKPQASVEYDPWLDILAAHRQLRVAGAVTWGSKLFLATLEGWHNHFSIMETKSAVLQLAGRDQQSVSDFFEILQSFTQRAGIRSIVVRAHAETGPELAKANSFRMEGILPLVPGAIVDFVDTRSISNWLSRAAPDLPPPWTAIGAQYRSPQKKAIQTAAFGIAHVTDPRYALRVQF